MTVSIHPRWSDVADVVRDSASLLIAVTETGGIDSARRAAMVLAGETLLDAQGVRTSCWS